MESDEPKFESFAHHLVDVGCWDESLNFAGPQFLHHLNGTINATFIGHGKDQMRGFGTALAWERGFISGCHDMAMICYL